MKKSVLFVILWLICSVTSYTQTQKFFHIRFPEQYQDSDKWQSVDNQKELDHLAILVAVGGPIGLMITCVETYLHPIELTKLHISA